MDAMLPRMMEAAGAIEELKACDRSYALGGADKYAESAGGGNYTSRTDIQVNQNHPLMNGWFEQAL